MFTVALVCVLSSATLLVSGIPTPSNTCCNTSKAVMDLPANQTTLVAPTTAPLFLALGVGVQNYSCSSTTSTYSSIGAVASLFDISCLDRTPAFTTIQTTAFDVWSKAPPSVKATSIGSTALLGYHYFVTSPSGTGISPMWDFTSTGKLAGNATAFVMAAKVGDMVAVTSPATNVDWLALDRVEGQLASKIFRIDTVGGQPPTSCVPGSAPISVKYTAKYFLY
ncbi:hypothetical protein B0H16DRAFT_1380142 [Mycena metata]|uniref:Malate dehydrogenase n=1 Tax=Mycena metata TaxID=1033252 RepID=A0AAD7I6G2_9AGAR|nr:hypothetical protein B0H16DRAFT_1380142 [Mycena metata]